MEALETRILARLGAADPYARRSRRRHEQRRTRPNGRRRRRPRAVRASSLRDCIERVRALFGLAPQSRRATTSRTRSRRARARSSAPQERAILKNVLALHDVRVEDVMVPRADVIALALDTPLRRSARLLSAPPAIPACRSMTRRSTTRAA